MECRDVRPLADSYLSEQLLVETNHGIVAHLERCVACRAEFVSAPPPQGHARRAPGWLSRRA